MRIVVLLLGLLAVGVLVKQQLGAGSQQQPGDSASVVNPDEVKQALDKALNEQSRRLEQHTEY